jgi:hypothetical protein
MSPQALPSELSEDRRKEIFRALVDTQDLQELTVPQSRQLIGKRYGLDEGQVRRIEREGLDLLWPPL